MASRRLRSGKKFGFVRFNGISNVRDMERKLNGIWIGSYRLRVFIANQGSSRQGSKDTISKHVSSVGKGFRDGRMYTEVVNPITRDRESGIRDKGKEPTGGEIEKERQHKEVLELHEYENGVEWLQRSVIATVIEVEMLE